MISFIYATQVCHHNIGEPSRIFLSDGMPNDSVKSQLGDSTCNNENNDICVNDVSIDSD